MENNKQVYIDKTADLQKRHEAIKGEMIRILDASKLLDDQYKQLESELYAIEEQYADTIKKMID
jgi:predicted  nucleic acid-binding Zn-ribbon protein